MDETHKTVQPGDDEWEHVLAGAASQPQQPQSPQPVQPPANPEAAVSAPLSSLKAPGYPLKMVADVASHVQRMFEALKGELPDTASVQGLVQKVQQSMPDAAGSVASAHAQLFLGVYGLDGIAIVNTSQRDWGSAVSDGKVKHVITSRLQRLDQTAVKLREYMSAVFGNNIFDAPEAADFNELPPDESVSPRSLDVLLPHLQQQLSFVNKALNMQAGPFASPYFIVMAMQPPDTRLLAARALMRSYATGMAVPEVPGSYNKRPSSYEKDSSGNPKMVPDYTFSQLSEEQFAITKSLWQAEAKKLGIQDIEPHRQAYKAAWSCLEKSIMSD